MRTILGWKKAGRRLAAAVFAVLLAAAAMPVPLRAQEATAASVRAEVRERAAGEQRPAQKDTAQAKSSEAVRGNAQAGTTAQSFEEASSAAVSVSGKLLAAHLHSYSDNAGTNHNAQLACERIDGITLQPGEIFSYNKALGKRTEENGYVMAPSYAGASTEETVGGGICRISTALYGTALRAGMTVLERHPHTMEVDYSPGGLDAAVTDGVQDFRFRNDLAVNVTLRAAYDAYGYAVWIEAPREARGGAFYDPRSEKVEDGWYRAYVDIYRDGAFAYTRRLGESYYWGSRAQAQSEGSARRSG